MGVVTDMFLMIEKHFSENVSGKLKPLSASTIWSNLRGTYDGLKIHEIASYCEILTRHGILLRVPSLSGNLNDGYLPVKNEKVTRENLDYGYLEFLVFGFLHIRNHFQKSVIPILVEVFDKVSKSTKSDIGTGFLYKERFIVTAKHCLENSKKIIINKDELEAQLLGIYTTNNDRDSADLAVLEFNKNPLEGNPYFLSSDVNILDSVLTMGFPPIPGFGDPLMQVAETAQVAGKLKSTTGSVVGEGKEYWTGASLFLISARVKGGNSGGPVINNEGKLVGIVSSSPTGGEGGFDGLGYGAITPANYLDEFLIKINNKNFEKSIPFELLEDGYRLLI
jgi:serine protease Do